MQFDPMTIALCGFGLNLLMATVLIAEKLFGGGNALANKFNKLERDTNAAITKLKDEHQFKLDNYAENTRVATDSIKTNLHLLEKGILEFRLEISQKLQEYMRRDSFYKVTDDLKRDFKEANTEIKTDMKDGFKRIEETLGEMTQAIEAARKHNQT